MKDIWSYSDQVDTHTYETHLYRLRQKIHSKLKDKKFIEIKDGKISLSIKALKQNPWVEAEKNYKKGQKG